jgi:hypothetical protein
LTSGLGKSRATKIPSDGEAGVLFVDVNDLDRFVLTQRETFQAARAHVETRSRDEELASQAAAMVAKIRSWCKRHPVSACYATPRPEDLAFVVIALDDDREGKLHDEMAQLDLELFAENRWRTYWLLLRASESSGLESFVNLADARLVFHADA